MAANKNTDWRANVAAMMTDPDFAKKASEAVENTRKVNTNLMNKSEEFKESLSLDKPTGKPLDLSRVQEMQTEQAARATMQGEESDYSGVSDLATKLYAEERKKRINNAQQGNNTYFGAPHGMRFSQAASDIRDEELAKRVQGIYDKVLQDESLSQAIHSNANKALLNAMEKNQSMSEDEQKKVYNESVTKQLEAIGKGIDKYLYDTNAPKSEAEWIAKNAVNSSIMGQMLTSPMNVEGGENVYRQQALADYGANASWLSQGLSTAGSLVIDTLPMMGIGTAFATPASKAAMWGVGKAGGRALQGSLAGRGFVGLVGGAANLGGYNAASALTTQFSNGQFDLGEIASSAGHGAIMGGLTGVMSPVLRGLSQGIGKVGKVAIMAGGLGAEAGIFTAAELAEMENPYDFETIAQTFGKNVAVIGGLKLSNLPKTLQEYKGWYNEGKQSNFTDADYKMMADFAKANGFANNDAFSMGADGTYSRSIADRVTGNRTLLELTKLEGGGEKTLAMEMYQDPNVPLSMKTKIAAKMGLPAPNPVLPNAVEARDNVVNTYYEYREQTSDGTYVTRRILVDSKEMPSKRKARAAASEFGRTKARQNSIIQSEAEANTDATNAIVMARLTEQAWRSGTNVSDEVARMYDIAQRAQRGEASAEDIAYYQSVMEGTTEVTDRIKADIKDKTGVDVDKVLKQEGTFDTAQDKALTMYSEALASLKDNSKPTTERGTTASQASVADYIELKGMGIEQTRQLLNDPAAKVAAEKDIRNKYALWLKYFDGQMSEEQLASRLGYNLDSTKELMDFVNEEAFFRGKAANRIAYNAANAAKRLLEQGSGGVRFTEDGKVKLQGVPYSIAVDESIVDRYRAVQQGSGENYQRIANDALKDIIRQSEQPIEEMLQQMATEEQAMANEPQTEQEVVTQQMVDNRLAEIDTDLQGIEADGIQRVNINDKPAMIVKGRIAYISNGEIDKANSSTEVAYIPLDENGRPLKNEQGKPVVEVGVKPSNVRISEVEPWRTVDDYKRAEEQRIRDNNRITDEAMVQVGAEDTEVKEELPTLDKVIVEPKDADELIAMCDGDKALALDVAVDELAKAQAAKGKGASTAETIDINRRIRTYQQIVDRLSASEMPDAAAAEVEPGQASEAAKAEPQVTEDMEFVYQQGIDENHDGMEPMQMADGRYKWVGLQRGELTATMGERDVELLDGLAKKLGVAVIPINVADSAVNGYYRDGNIYVNTNRGAEWTMRWVAGHEMLHDVAKKSPEAYDAYKQAVLDMWGSDYINDQVKQIIDDYAASGKTIDREQALTELVNDFGGELFNSRDGLNILDNILKGESRKGNTGFVNTIKQWWERLKEFFGVTPYASEVEKKLADAYKEAIANAEKFGKNYDFDYSIIGKRGAENLDKVEEATIRLDNLAIAREMESSGKDAKTIRMATGWERGADNKWRYEIPDELDLTDGEIILNIAIDKAKWKRAAEKLGTTAESLKSENDNLKAEVERRRMISTIEQMLADNESTNDLYVRELKKSTLLKQLNFYKTGLKYKDSDDVEKMWADLKDSIDKVDVLKLSEVMGADNAIFKAYPELADIDVRFDAKGNTSVLATVSNDGKEIWINPYNIESQSSVFLHEIQHLIQKIEGFARGGSSRMFDIPEEHKYANMPGSVIKSMREQAEFARKKLSEYSTIEEIREYYKANRSWLTSSEKDAVISVMDALMYGESVEDAVSSLEKDYQQAIDDLNWSLTSKDSPYSKYTRLGGEVESRNVQNRMNMTDEERRNTLLSETEDVAREDQILLFDNLGESQMGSRVDKRMAEIGSYFSERELNDNERAVVDVFGGKADNKSLTVMRDGKEHKVVMRQGTENKAGTKHSLFRHYGTNVGVITNDDLLLIPEVIERGERTDKGNNRVYQLEKNGARYTVLTEQQNRTERFCDFYSNKKGDNTRSSNTQLSAQAYSDITNYTAKVEQNSDNAKKSGENLDAENNIVRNLKERPAEVANDDLIANEGAEMSIVRDRNKIEELENEELVPMFRTFQILDGALYSPMATIQRGKKVHSVVEGDWWKADENPDLAKVKAKGKKDEFYDKDDDRISKKDGQWVITIDGEDKPLATNGNSLSYYFNLKKGEKGDVVTDDLDVSYNPYIHSSKSALNDQFKGAYLRPNLVLAEVLVPKSELDGTNRYKADYAKDGIGEVDWNSGTVIKQAVAAGHPGRKVALSRYAKIGKVFTDAEWADKIDEELSAYKEQITLPFVAFPPDVLRELANKGYKVEPPTSKKAQPYYEAWLKGEEPTDPNGGGIPTEEFSIKADKELEKKSLVGVHNLTEDNLRYALNLGGLANPSTAVINKDIMGLEGFGDISLIMPKSLVAKSSGKNAGTFAGDAYTPRFPRGSVVKYMTKDGEKAVMKDYPGKDKFSQDFRSAIYSLGDEYGGVTPTLYYMYKLENGGADIIKTKAPEFKSDKHKRMVEKFGQKEWYELSDAEKQELFDFRKEEMQEMLKNADKELVSKRMSKFANYPVDDVAYDKLRTLQAEYKKLQNAGEIDYAATYRNAQDDIALAGEQANFGKWLSQISAKYGIEDRIFRGYTPSGNRKYAPLTLANLSKIMKEQGRAGEESLMGKSVYSLRAKMLPAFKTLESIRKNKSKITDEETYNKRREEISSEYNDLIFAIVKLPNVEYDDAHYVLEDALTKGFAYAEKTANTKFDDAVKARIVAFGKLLTEAPSKYFETKFERPVMFNEFVAAVVPKDINPELRKALTDNGLAVEEYKRGDETSRLEAIRKASDRDDVQFSIKGGNTPEGRADEVARLKQRIEQLSQEKDAIAEDGAKVKDIASEMTNFIKQNISTEVQSDMTRNQFKGILNQLENAVTKKDLEKPMQMIEYIGTNVTRRSLTRQMRTFLKSEFKAMTPQGAVKAKTVDGATSRVLELAKTMYATMNKLPLGGEVAALQKQMRDLKADATEWATDQSADTKNLLADVLKVTERPAATRYSELTELRNKVAADGSASGEMLGYIDHMLDIMGDIDYFRGEQQKAKEASALNSKEDLEALKSELLDKSDKGILSEEDKAVLDNMPLYEMMVNLRQQQLDIDGGGAASIDAQIRNKQNAIKAYRAKMNELPKTDTTGRERYKKLIEQVGGEIDDLFASRIVDQKAVNNGMRELIDDLVTLKEQGHSRLVEWSKGKQERSNGIRKLANDSFSSTARGYWDEVNKKGHRMRDINNFLNNAKLTMISPALSFEYMLGTLDKKYYTNDSPIYNRFIKSQDGLLKANDNFFEGLEAYNREVNAAANRLIGRGAITNMAEWFNKGDRFATEEIPFAFEVDQMFDDGTVRKVTRGITATMTRGQAAKIYAWSRMTDGMAKLKAHGVTDETIAAVKDFIGEGYMRFVDWVEDDFFPRLRREKYNPKYKEIYGISMAENEHYFPFAIYKKDVRTDTDLEQIGDDKLGGGLVGNLIERKRNNARLDFTRNSPDIFDMITRYGETMEEWNAYAQVREDLKAMVNDKQFKVKCDMFGTDYYKHFLEAARVASRTSDDKALAGKWNTSMSKLQKVLASGAISMRVSTALKQLLSAPAFAVYSLDPKFLHQLEKTVVPIDVESAIKGLWKIGSGDLQEAKKLLLNENWVGHYNWCVNNLPSFRERVSLGGAGNPILEEKGFGGFFGKLCDAVQSAGMIPNRLVDAFTCSIGAKAVYEYNFNKYKKMYGEKTAHNMAVTEAEIAFNSSQQSSNPVFLSPMQVSKQFFLRGLMNFKNSPIGYLRAGLKANIDIVRAIKSIYNPTFKVDGQEMRFNSNGKNANSMLMTAATRSAMYNFFLNFIWNFGVYGIAGLSYTAIRNLSGEGNEDGNLLYSDEEWEKAKGDNLAGTLFLCATQGLPYISGPFATAEQGTEFAPLMLLNTLNEMGTDIYQHGLVSPVTAQWITNLALKNGTGIDPQVCAQVYEGAQGILADRPVTEEDIMNLLASPRSAISGMTKQNVGKYKRLRDYVNARIKSNREIGIDEHMDFGKALAGKRELRKSNLDYYIDEYLEANIPGYREISGRKSKETKQEEQANKKLYEQSMSLVEKIVGTPKGEADEQKASKIDSKDEDIKYMVRRLRDAVAAIHKLYAAGDYSTAEDIATEMKRRIERGYDPNGKTLDERLKNVDIWEPVGKVNQDSHDGYYTNFDRAIGGEFKKMYVGKMNGEGN